ncbi:MAG: baseplate J/gp47 family protein [archaeon]|jgi:uncharacterized phage protein gp47/JayE
MANVTIKDEDQMSTEALRLLQDNTQITNVSDGTLARALIRAISDMHGKQYRILTRELANGFLSTATGVYLDMFGVLLSTPRGSSTLAGRENVQRFYSTDGLTPIASLVGAGSLGGVIPAGTIVQSGNGSIRYEVVFNVPFSSTDLQVMATVRAVTEGVTSNVGTNILTTHSLSVTGLSTTNILGISNGTDIQGDSEYRYMLSKAITAAEAANEISIRLAALSVAGVSDVRLLPYFHGVGTFTVLVIGTTPVVSAQVLEGVRAAVSGVTALGEFFSVRGPRYIGTELQAKLIFRDDADETARTSIAARVTDVLYEYINNLPLGEGLVWNEIIQRIMETSPLIHDIDDDPASASCLRVWTWTPTIMDIINNVETYHRVKEELKEPTRNYEAYSDDKMIVEQDLQGFVHEANFTPIRITWE